MFFLVFVVVLVMFGDCVLKFVSNCLVSCLNLVFYLELLVCVRLFSLMFIVFVVVGVICVYIWCLCISSDISSFVIIVIVKISI